MAEQIFQNTERALQQAAQERRAVWLSRKARDIPKQFEPLMVMLTPA